MAHERSKFNCRVDYDKDLLEMKKENYINIYIFYSTSFYYI